jgi:hypothetical protein
MGLGTRGDHQSSRMSAWQRYKLLIGKQGGFGSLGWDQNRSAKIPSWTVCQSLVGSPCLLQRIPGALAQQITIEQFSFQAWTCSVYPPPIKQRTDKLRHNINQSSETTAAATQ